MSDEAVKEEWKRKRELRRRLRREQQENDTENGEASLLASSSTKEDTASLLTAAKRRKLELEQFLQSRGGARRDARKREEPATKAQPSTPNDSNVEKDRDTTTPGESANQQGETATTTTQPSSSTNNLDNQKGDDTNNNNSTNLMDQMEELQSLTVAERTERQRQHEEEMLLRQAKAQMGGKNALQSAKDVASGLVYTQPMPSTWRIPQRVRHQADQWPQMRQDFFISAQGKDIPPPLTSFADMKLPQPILNLLASKQISKPTPIQMQGIPVALSGRDLVGIAFTGSGKTLAFTLPAIMVALEQELIMPLWPGEGPLCLLMAPSRELARQTYEIMTEFFQAITDYAPQGKQLYPQLNSLLIVGGEPMGAQVRALQETPIHCIVCTAGRVRMLLKEQRMTFDHCRFICLDEADRLLDLGFDEDVGDIFNFFVHQKQTLLFSATFPQKFQDFCRQTLVQPIVVNVGRAGAANLDVIQEVEYVKEENKLVYLLSALQKTAPPVCIFSERQRNVDDIHEYLLLKGVQAVSIHGGKDQQERNAAIALFKSGEKDVLIATDVAAKGLDFPNIQHVINYDMPTEIENYVHRIGRTGRCGKTGVATTFINNKSCDETTLLDLKGLLREARQRIPPVLEMLEDPRPTEGAGGAEGGCSFCGGLGHSIVDCPKIEKDSKRLQRGHYDALQMGGGDW